MNENKHLILNYDKNITPDVVFFKYNRETGKYDVTFKSGKTGHYAYNSIEWISKPLPLNPADMRIYTKKLRVVQGSGNMGFLLKWGGVLAHLLGKRHRLYISKERAVILSLGIVFGNLFAVFCQMYRIYYSGSTTAVTPK